jgi:glycosyltransferase involved in cell wall biosynthesis
MKVLYLSKNDGTDMRVTKMCNSLAALGHEVVLVGWDRDPTKQKTLHLHESVKLRIYSKASASDGDSPSGWMPYLPFVLKALREERPDVVQAVNEDLSCLVAPFKGVYFRSLVIDIFDSIETLRSRNALLRQTVPWIKRFAYERADAIIETSEKLAEFLGDARDKSVIIMNCPVDPGRELTENMPDGDQVQLCLGGSLTRDRDGLDTLLAAIDLMPEGSVKVNASGWLYDEYAKNEFNDHPAVDYQWLDSPRDFLVQASQCDAILYLRTDSDNSAYRSWVMPNRIFDCLAIGKPVIVNSDANLSIWAREANLGYICAVEPQALADLFGSLIEKRAKLAEYSHQLRAMYDEQYNWPVMEKRLGALYDSLR